jgi:hypothetical protein
VNRPAFYARTGTKAGDFISILHVPYTAWHLGHVAIGAALAPDLDWFILAGTLLTFFFGLGIGAHALDELHGRPLRTALGRRLLWGLGIGGMLIALGLSIAGMSVVSPWVLAWAAAGFALAIGYAFERPRWLHTPLGFALAWGAFPTLVGYWAQTQTIEVPVIIVSGAMTFLSLAQRALSTPARQIRRSVERAELVMHRTSSTETWSESQILASWERPLKLLVAAVLVLTIGLLLAR